MNFKVWPRASPVVAVLTDKPRASLLIESLTTSRRSRDCCLDCKEAFGRYVCEFRAWFSGAAD
ncbi:hypothetical protein SADUNF_Sadunf17G0092400 [Salix dunnii]|uniref:Uncharacterized protein n=1 Tax=Salix dunnii TaxID=1413687 RepID=A0A835J3D2_9ROSI|nr:hypothetical protein SADUNF_Sadunf17G0092400 [Salix dunnii]